ncbi:Oxidase ustYa [Colletotrichum orbiculare MAFF 240422]|uniref:Oxidase ustYa n=1 Tax=Colletotrichum orbiculare (strain 104-T / ATCC 96160 / CBS 514.97 / LARS 414 / MAFF 240422) TaxID=1213857 RepID=A0A484FWR9_COLOR|nr:Oxidase ustYa [Colletotrichum orbiculare MAFF 240422]
MLGVAAGAVAACLLALPWQITYGIRSQDTPSALQFPVASDINGLFPNFPLQLTTLSDLAVAWPSTESWMRGQIAKDEWNQFIHGLHSLVPHGGGFLKVDDPKRFLLPPPLELPWPGKPNVYGISVFHQFHCLEAILNQFQLKHDGQPLSQSAQHLLHCFDYLRQAILCCGDCTTETFDRDGLLHHRNTVGMKTPRVCKRFDRILDFAKANAPRKPDDS